jgi:hypothetical protein
MSFSGFLYVLTVMMYYEALALSCKLWLGNCCVIHAVKSIGHHHALFGGICDFL